MAKEPEVSETDIAIVGMAAHLPGARNIHEFWQNLKNGVESVKFFTEEELLTEGESLENIRKPNYVPATAILQDVDMFDAEFFGFSPKEAAIMDPQHRHFIESAWEALEDAGHPPDKFEGNIGIFAGCGMGAYFIFNLLTNKDLVENVGLFLLRHTSNDKDFLVTRVSYLFNLKGPSVNVQTACSTSLVAAHMACQSLLSGECDMALAGGVTIEIPHRRGYLYHEGEVLSPDGHCHAFDHRGKGTVFGSGAGVVVLRRLADALADGDYIHAIIKGSAVNNDGSSKVGYLAPSVDGQAAAMIESHVVANVTADTIGYVECHGTGTYMGDPIEISALTNAFRQTTDKKQYCRISSVKTNIGHLDTAAGVASLIKASLALQNRQIPPSLNFEKPNPTIDFENSPFMVNTSLYDWPAPKEHPRRAAVNSLGVGGTNAHVVVEEAPLRKPSSPAKRPYQLLTYSAKNRKSLDEYGKKLAAHLRAHPEQPLADVAFSLLHGRKTFDQRRVLAARDHEEAASLLEAGDTQRIFTLNGAEKAQLVFMFPGGGSQYARMAHGLYEEPVFKTHLDKGLTLLKKKFDFDFKSLLFPADEDFEKAQTQLEDVRYQLPAIFIVEYALAQLWLSWGVEPTAFIGHSLGENTAACLAGVFSYEDCLNLVCLRGELVNRVSGTAAMLSVPLSPATLEPMLQAMGDLDLAIVNGPELCVVSGTVAAIEKLEQKLIADEVDVRRIRIKAAGHSRILDPILPEFRAFLKTLRLNPPKGQIISNRTGTWLTKEQATDPEYWVGHLRGAVRFADGLSTLLSTPGRVFLEVGPGRILSSLVRQHPDSKAGTPAIPSLRHQDEKTPDLAFFTTVLGRLWAAGAKVELDKQWANETRQRVQLPTYAFNRAPYWIKPGKLQTSVEETKYLLKQAKLDDWFYHPVWRLRSVEQPNVLTNSTWLVFLDDVGLGRRVVDRLRGEGHTVLTVREGDSFFKRSDTEYVLAPERGREGYDALVKDLVAHGKVPTHILHLWLVTAEETFRPGSSFFHRNLERGFYSLFFLAQALGDENVPRPLHLYTFTTGAQKVGNEPLAYPEKATILGPAKVIPRELTGSTSLLVDVELPKPSLLSVLPVDPIQFLSRVSPLQLQLKTGWEELVEQVLGELKSAPKTGIAALRGDRRYEQEYERAPNTLNGSPPRQIRQNGVFLITGGLGGLGLVMAEELARVAKARLILLGRGGLPPREQWDQILRSQGPGSRMGQKIAKVLDLEALGAEVIVASADVTDLDSMREVVSDAKKRWGAIHGVVHTAGVVDDDLLQLKTMSDVENVFTPKVHGTQVLDEALKEEALDFMVLFSSTSTATAPTGQIDYVAANAFLNAYAEKRSSAATYTVAINWGIWNEVGMAATTLLGKAELPELEPDKPVHHPLFDARVKDKHGQSYLVARYATRDRWLLDEHRTKSGAALIPGTGYIEIARAALVEYESEKPFEIEDLYFFRPLHVPDDEPKEVRVKLKHSQEGYAFEIRSKRTLEGKTGWELHAQATLRLPVEAPKPKTIPIKEIEARCQNNRQKSPDGIRTGQENYLRFGPRWRVLKEVGYGQKEAMARVELGAQFASDLEVYKLHPALLDLATGFAMGLIEGYDPASNQLWVPVSYKRVRVYGPLPQKGWSWIKSAGANKVDADFATFDVAIADDEGRVWMEIEQFSIKKTSADIDFARSTPSLAELELEKGADRQLSPAELQLQRILEQGILPKEGMQAFERILTHETKPLVVVSSLELNELIKQTAATVVEKAEAGTKFARPNLDTEYMAPRDDVERTIVGLWEELLGVEQVGVKDNFFDLGGHSLIAVRLFAQIKKAYQVDYPISVLFEAPTIERVASMLKTTIGFTGDATTSEVAAPQEPPKPRYTHLVSMHPGEPGPRRPFFLVAGMFGNVLNLRHLAHLLGHDRPFYGLQARGLYGDTKPHETFEETARDYIAEMMTVQPKGPYLIGGFSGGGITALEIAHQLQQRGETVELVVMLDSLPPTSPDLTSKEKAQIHVIRLQKKGPGYFTEWASNRIEWEVGKVKKRLGLVETEEGPAEFHNAAIEAAFRRALTLYQVPNYSGRVLLFRPKLDQAYVFGPGRVANSKRELIFPDNGWGQWLSNLEIREVPGDHDAMVLEPNVRVLATRMRKAIEAAEAAIDARTRDDEHRPIVPAGAEAR